MTEKSEQKKLLEKASAKNEQEIIEEIYLTSMRSQNWKNTKSSTILAISKALQKGKELGAEKAYTCSCEFGCNPCHALCNKCAVFGQAQKASKIAELQALNDQLINANREHNRKIGELEKENNDLKKQLSKMNSSLQIKLNKTRKLANRYNKALAFRKKDSVSLSCLRLEISKLANELEKEDMRNITVSYVQNLVKRLRGEK